MTIPKIHDYPGAATNSTWQKAKTTGDKLLTKTGLGAKLTDAEKKFNAVPWTTMSAGSRELKTLDQAQMALKQAAKDMKTVDAAKLAVTAAYDEARVTAAIKGLSAATKKAATDAATALDKAKKLLEIVNIKDFEERVAALTAPAKISKISVEDGKSVVATAGAGEWKRDTKELTVSSITWKVSDLQINTYKTGKLIVHGQSEDNENGRASDFLNDMKLVTGSKSASQATFKSLH